MSRKLHHEALVPYLHDRRECHLANLVFGRKLNPLYIHVPGRQLRMYEAPILIEYQSHNATFERSVLYNDI